MCLDSRNDSINCRVVSFIRNLALLKRWQFVFLNVVYTNGLSQYSVSARKYLLFLIFFHKISILKPSKNYLSFKENSRVIGSI